MLLRSFAARLLATALLVTASATAQHDGSATLGVNPDPLVAGGVATITYSNPALAEQTVVIDIDNGLRRGTIKTTVTIVLDSNGNGSTTWTVPNWYMAKFNAPGAAEVGLMIVGG